MANDHDPIPSITITLTYRNGNVSVEAPLDDQVFCYGMAELFKDVVRAHKQAKREAAAAAAAQGLTPGGVALPGSVPIPPIRR